MALWIMVESGRVKRRRRRGLWTPGVTHRQRRRCRSRPVESAGRHSDSDGWEVLRLAIGRGYTRYEQAKTTFQQSAAWVGRKEGLCCGGGEGGVERFHVGERYEARPGARRWRRGREVIVTRMGLGGKAFYQKGLTTR